MTSTKLRLTSLRKVIPASVPRNLLVPAVKTKRSGKHRDKKKEDQNKIPPEDLTQY